jgi:hypothetical protein
MTLHVGVLGQVLEVVLLLEEPLTRQKWCLCHPVLRAKNLDY